MFLKYDSFDKNDDLKKISCAIMKEASKDNFPSY